MTNKKIAFITGLISVSFAILILFISKIVFETHNSAKCAAVDSTAASLCSSLCSYLNRGYSRANATPQSTIGIDFPIDRWHVLEKDQYDQTIAALSRFYYIDAQRGWDHSKPLHDAWGQRFVVAIRRGSNQAYEVIVTSLGPDGIVCTDDDITRPTEIKIPKEVIDQLR